MRRFVSYAVVSLLTTSLGIALTIWLASRNRVRPPIIANIPIKTSDDKGDIIEIVFRDLIHRYQSHPVYFFSFAESDPSDEFMARFQDDPRIKKLSQAVRNANQAIDRESGVIGVHVQAGVYYPLNENEVLVGAVWELSERLGKDPKWIIWDVEYRMQKVSGKWVSKSFKIVPPIP
jgi:hypothetical protein